MGEAAAQVWGRRWVKESELGLGVSLDSASGLARARGSEVWMATAWAEG